MAIDKTLMLSSGIPTQYHRVTAIRVSYRPDAALSGQVGVVHVSVGSYVSQEARDNGMKPVLSQTLQIPFGAEISDTPTLRTPMPGRVIPETEVVEGTDKVRIKAVSFAAPEPIKLAVIRSNDPTRSDIYAALMTVPQFKDGQMI